jgi:hypothetical protein
MADIPVAYDGVQQVKSSVSVCTCKSQLILL